MPRPAVVSVIGRQNAGKTHLAARMIGCWTDAGLQVGAVKHDGHLVADAADDWEKPASDSVRLATAGAAIVALAGGGRSLMRLAHDPLAEDASALVDRLSLAAAAAGQPLDIVVVEGFSRTRLPAVAVARTPEDMAWIQTWTQVNGVDRLRAVVCTPTMTTLADACWRVYDEDDIGRLCREIVQEA